VTCPLGFANGSMQRRTEARRARAGLRAAVAGALVALAACVGHGAGAGGGPESGFLHQYDDLRPGSAGEPTRVHVAADTRLQRFRKVHVEKVALFLDAESRATANRESAIAVGTGLGEALRTGFASSDHELVDRPDADTLVVRAALTQRGGTFVSVEELPVLAVSGEALTPTAGFAEGWRPCRGPVSIELELLAGAGGPTLLRLVEDRVAGRRLTGERLGSWRAARGVFSRFVDELLGFLAGLDQPEGADRGIQSMGVDEPLTTLDRPDRR
jgi:hypothetical protein